MVNPPAQAPIGHTILMLPHLYLLDEPHVQEGERRLELAPARPTYLLVYLACRGEWVSREALAGLLWPERPEEEARHNLRVSLHRARSLPWAKGLEVERERLRLILGTDVAEFRAAIGRADWGAALAWHRRPFLQGFPLHDAPAFEEWASLERQALLEAWQGAALRHAEGLQEQGEHLQAARLLGELLRHDPLAEDVLQGYLRAAYLAGEREAALRAYERFAQELWRELELEPMGATVELAQTLRRALPLELKAKRPQPQVPLEVLRPPRLVGQEGEQARLRGARLALVQGEPGVGKSRLLQETFPEAPLIRCREGLERLPFFPLLEYLRTQLDRLPDLGPYRQDLARLLPELAPGQALPPPDPLTSKARLLEALARALEPLDPLLVDDLQWADEGTLELLVCLGSRGRGVIGAYRSQEVGPALARTLGALRGMGTLEMALEPLDPHALEALLGDLIGSGEGPPLFSAWLHRHSGGNPFFALETLRALFESRVLWVEGGAWHTSLDEITRDYSELQVPPRVAEVVRRRLERLSEPARRVVQAASVVGEGFSARLLAGVAGLSEWAALEALEELEAAGLLTEAAFSHDLTRQSLYHALSEERRRMLHRIVAERLEGRAEPELVAEHWSRAGEPGKAAHRWQQAAHRYHSRGLPAQAAAFYRRALAASPEEAQRLRLQLELATALEEQASYAEAQALVASALPQVDDPRIQAYGLMLLARLRLMAGELEEAQQGADQAERLLGQADESELGLQLQMLRHTILIRQGRAAEAFDGLAPHLERLRRGPPSAELASMLIALATWHLDQGRYAEGREASREALEIARQGKAHPHQVYAASNLLVAGFRLSCPEEAFPAAEEALALGQYEGTNLLRANLATAYLRLERYAEALSHAQVLIREAQGTFLEGTAWAILADSLWGLGRREEAQQALERCLELLPHTQVAGVSARILMTLCRLGDDAQLQRAQPFLAALAPHSLPPASRAELARVLEGRGIAWPSPDTPAAATQKAGAEPDSR
jgi:DNA-binding SARP family transcriptional activator/tetratricopeptide (TPR) repeat protein